MNDPTHSTNPTDTTYTTYTTHSTYTTHCSDSAGLQAMRGMFQREVRVDLPKLLGNLRSNTFLPKMIDRCLGSVAQKVTTFLSTGECDAMRPAAQSVGRNLDQNQAATSP